MSNDLCTCPTDTKKIFPAIDYRCPRHGMDRTVSVDYYAAEQHKPRTFPKLPQDLDLADAIDLLDDLVKDNLDTVTKARVLTWIKMMRGLMG